MSMIKAFVLLGMLGAGALGITGQEQCKRNVEPQGGFSLCVPEGWTVSEKEGEKYKLYFAPAGERFTPNINMKHGVSTMTLDEYATSSVDYILKNYTQFGATSVTALTRETQTTGSGLAFIKLTFRAEYKSLLIRTIQYLTSASPQDKLILTCTALEADQVNMDPVCDRAAKSLQLEEKASPPKVE